LPGPAAACCFKISRCSAIDFIACSTISADREAFLRSSLLLAFVLAFFCSASRRSPAARLDLRIPQERLDASFFSLRAPLIAAIPFALLDHPLCLRSPVGGERTADVCLIAREFTLLAAHVTLVTLVAARSIFAALPISCPRFSYLAPPIRPRQNRLSPARDRTPAWLARRAGSRRQHAAGCSRSGGILRRPAPRMPEIVRIESAATPKATEQPREDDTDTRLSRKAMPARCGSSPAGSGI
jgi:hypothetical protein